MTVGKKYINIIYGLKIKIMEQIQNNDINTIVSENIFVIYDNIISYNECIQESALKKEEK